MYYEFEIMTTFVKQDKDGNEIVVKRNATYKATFYIRDISSVEEALDGRGRILKNRCLISHSKNGSLIVKGKYHLIKDMIFNGKKIEGYGSIK